MKDGRADSSNRRAGARPRLFISYRRRSDQASARLLKGELTRAFGEGAVFRDVDDIEAGEAFPQTIDAAVRSCDVFLLLVSPGWVGLVEELHNPDDFVRREVAAALARQVPVIPVLLGDARMPKPDELPEEIRELAFRQGLELSDDRWDYDVARLVKLVGARAGLAPRTFLRTWPGKAAAVVAVGVLAAAVYAAYLYNAAGVTHDKEKVQPSPTPAPNYAECLNRLRVPGTLEAKVRVQEKTPAGEPPGEAIVGVDQYGLTQPPPPGGLPLLVRLDGPGGEFGAVSLRFLRGDYPKDRVAFKVEKVVEPPCVEVTDYYNKDSKAKSEVYNWDGLSLRLGGRDYRLRLGDHGRTLLATLTPETE